MKIETSGQINPRSSGTFGRCAEQDLWRGHWVGLTMPRSLRWDTERAGCSVQVL